MTATLASALVAAQKEMPAVAKSATANTGTYSYSYATLDAIISGTRSVLNKHGLAISQLPSETTTGGPGLKTLLLHAESGESIEATVPLLLNGKHDMQSLGGAITYARRYGWAAVLGIANDEDDDGALASTASAAVAGETVTEPAKRPPASPTSNGAAPTEKQVGFLRKLLTDGGFTPADLGVSIEELTKQQASQFIEALKGGTFVKAGEEVRVGYSDPDEIPFAPTLDGWGL